MREKQRKYYFLYILEKKEQFFTEAILSDIKERFKSAQI